MHNLRYKYDARRGSITRNRGNNIKQKESWRADMNKASVPIAQHDVSRGILLPRCILCEQVPNDGIRGGIRVKRAFICTKCEQQLIQSDVSSIDYQKILEKIKMILK